MTQVKGRTQSWKIWSSIAGIVLLVSGLWIGPRFVDWSPYKGGLESLISDQLGVDLTIRGRLQIEILPQPRITIADILVTGSGTSGAIRWLRGSLDPRALLMGRLIPQDLELVEADLELPLQLASKGRYDGATSVTIEASRLRLLNGPDWLPDQLERINGRLSLGAGPGGAGNRLFAFDGEARLLNEPIGISLEGRIDGGLTLSIGHGPSATDLALQGRPLDGGGWTGGATLIFEETGFLSTLRAEAVTRLLGEGPATLDTRIEVQSDGILTLTVESLDSRQMAGNGIATLIPGPNPAVDLQFNLSRIDLSQMGPPQSRLAQDLAQALDTFSGLDISAEIQARTVTLSGATLRDGKIALSAGQGVAVISDARITLPGNATATLIGALDPQPAGWRFEGQMGLTADDLRPLLAWRVPSLSDALATLPQDRLRNASLSATILIEPDLLDVSALSGRLDDTVWSGAVTLIGATGQRESQIVLQGDTLNLDRYLPDSDTGAERIVLSAVQTLLDAGKQNLSLQFDRMSLAGMPAIDVSLGLRTHMPGAQILVADLGFGNLAGAQVAAQFSMENGQSGRAEIDADIPAPERFLGALGLSTRRAAALAGFGSTGLRIDLSFAPERGIGYAVEAMGTGGDMRMNGLFNPGPIARLTVTDGSFNGTLGGFAINLYDTTATCERLASGDITCREIDISLPGLHLSGQAKTERMEAGTRLTVNLNQGIADLGLLSGRSGMPLVPDGQLAATGTLTGEGSTLETAFGALSGTLTLEGEAALAFRRQGGGQLGNTARLRREISNSFGRPGALTGEITLHPDGHSGNLRLEGAVDTVLSGQVRIPAALDRLSADLTVRRPGIVDPLLSLTADGLIEAPGMRVNGPWVRGH